MAAPIYSNVVIIGIVVGELNKRKIIIPTIFEIDHARSQHILKGLNVTLYLSIRLRVKCCAKVNLSTKTLLK